MSLAMSDQLNLAQTKHRVCFCWHFLSIQFSPWLLSGPVGMTQRDHRSRCVCVCVRVWSCTCIQMNKNTHFSSKARPFWLVLTTNRGLRFKLWWLGLGLVSSKRGWSAGDPYWSARWHKKKHILNFSVSVFKIKNGYLEPGGPWG